MGNVIGHFFFEKLQLIQEEETRERVRHILAKNIQMLSKSYENPKRYEELYCIRAIARYIMNGMEYFLLIECK